MNAFETSNAFISHAAFVVCSAVVAALATAVPARAEELALRAPIAIPHSFGFVAA